MDWKVLEMLCFAVLRVSARITSLNRHKEAACGNAKDKTGAYKSSGGGGRQTLRRIFSLGAMDLGPHQRQDVRPFGRPYAGWVGLGSESRKPTQEEKKLHTSCLTNVEGLPREGLNQLETYDLAQDPMNQPPTSTPSKKRRLYGLFVEV